ncbi:hypothetical protein ES707_07641 [subsurface metagenome]
MKLKTRVFELWNGRYQNLIELAQTMEISRSQIYRVRDGKRGINGRFIIGATKAFPNINLTTFSMSQRKARMNEEVRASD